MGKSVLVIEDDALSMKLATDLLHFMGILAIQSSHGEDAERLIQVNRPHLILLDIRLPGRSGLHITRSLKANPTTAEIPIVVLTAFTTYGTRNVCLEYGCDDYLSKPLSINHFRHTVEKHIYTTSLQPN